MSKHYEHSSFREKLIEHLFIGEMLKLSWQKDDCQADAFLNFLGGSVIESPGSRANFPPVDSLLDSI